MRTLSDSLDSGEELNTCARGDAKKYILIYWISAYTSDEICCVHCQNKKKWMRAFFFHVMCLEKRQLRYPNNGVQTSSRVSNFREKLFTTYNRVTAAPLSSYFF